MKNQEKFLEVSNIITEGDNMERLQTGASIFGVAIGAHGGWPLYRLIRSMVDEGTRRCGMFALNTMRRRNCMMQVKIKALEMLQQEAKKNGDTAKVKEISSKLEIVKQKLSLNSKHLDDQDKGAMRPKYKGTGVRFFDTGT